jgi:nicotinamide-nucleotide amidase
MNAKIIAIGDEILQGQTLDTNSNYLAQKLTELSFRVEKILVIGDRKKEIIEALDNSINKYNLIVFTGGLGPTSDDITKKTLTEYFNGELIQNNEVLKDVENFINARGFKLNENNKKQALVPSNCKIVRNPNGTAPGMIFKKNNTTIISMPGVPFEMKQMFEEKIIPEMKKIFDFPTKCIKFVHTLGIPEAQLAEKLANFEKELPNNIKIAYLPSPEDIKIRLWAFGGFQRRLCEIINEKINELHKLLGNAIFGTENDTLETVLAKLLTENKKTLSTAESCTGGNIAHLITSVPGSSNYFKGGIISYSNEVKINNLNINEQTIETFGAVSEQTVSEMVIGAINLFKTDYAIAVSGIAGPTGGSKEKPVGTTWIAVASKNKIITQKFTFGTRRDINIRRASASAIHMLINFIKQNN